ncbi:MAG: hypothetical protein JWO67_2593 [Streptosporangiaceae bacterium]|nr:hypothetical protein [Streptosporangiaceae bacterium]
MSSPEAPCGTWTAYKRHKRRGEDACGPCIEAQRVRSRARYGEHRDRYLANANGRYTEGGGARAPSPRHPPVDLPGLRHGLRDDQRRQAVLRGVVPAAGGTGRGAYAEAVPVTPAG